MTKNVKSQHLVASYISQLARVRLDGEELAAPDNEARRDQGRIHCSNVMLWWFAINEWTHPGFADLCDWALNEDRAVHPSQISHIRNKKMRMFGLRVLDGFGAVNLATWAANTDKTFLSDLGVRPFTPEIEKLVMGKTSIMNPHTDLPLTQGGWMELFLGYLTIPAVLSGKMDASSESVKHACSQVASYLNDVIMASNLDPMTAFGRIEARLGAEKAEWIIGLMFGSIKLTPEQLISDALDIASAATALDGIERSPMGLIEQLSKRG